MNSHEVCIHIHQGCFAGIGAIVTLPQCQWSKPDGYGTISQCITTTKHNKAKTVCIFLEIYCISICIRPDWILCMPREKCIIELYACWTCQHVYLTMKEKLFKDSGWWSGIDTCSKGVPRKWGHSAWLVLCWFCRFKPADSTHNHQRYTTDTVNQNWWYVLMCSNVQKLLKWKQTLAT